MAKKIMLVEDEVLIGMMVKKRIVAQGYQVGEVYTTGEEAVEKAQEERPDLIIMDIVLAGKITGIEAARQIKGALDIPVVFFTGNNTDQKIIDQSKEISPVAVVDKLGSSGELFQAIEKAFHPA